MFRPSLARALPLLVAVLGSFSAWATPETFTDRSAWDAATAGGHVIGVDFDDAAADTSFASAPLDLGPFSIVQSGGPVYSSVNKIDVPPASSASESVDGSAFARGFVNAGDWMNGDEATLVHLVFEVPVYAWGADFASVITGEGLDFVLVMLNEDEVTVGGPTADDGFFGFAGAPSELFSELYIVPAGVIVGFTGERFGMDNVVSVTAPEPAPAGLVAAGLAVLAAFRRRRR
jgi:MYXO-CTERM domain-containing protein